MYSTELTKEKSSLKWLEVPIHKFNVAIPHFVEVLTTHHNNIKKLKRLKQWEQIQREHTSASRIVNQLSSLLNEVENLRCQVIDSDVTKFDKLINSSKESALTVIRMHKDMPCYPTSVQSSKDEDQIDIKNQELKDEQLQIVASFREETMKQEKYMVAMDEIEENINDINVMFQDLSHLVHDQGEDIDKIEEHVEKAHENVIEGESMLCQAAKYKNGMYPLFGALIGTVVGGPVGLLAGLKLGSLTAVGCGFLGFTGGKFLKYQTDVTINEAEQNRQELDI